MARAPKVAVSVAGLLSACAAGANGGGFDSQSSSDGSSGTTPQDSSSSLPSQDGPASPSPPDGSASVVQDASASPADASAPPAQDSGGASYDSTGTMSAPESGSPETASPTCPTPAPNADTLPFAVDVGAAFVPSGYEGDFSAIMMPTDPTCGGNRSSASALGNCHPAIYAPLAAGGTTMGWAGVLWQHPANNWGTAPGYAVPAGASKISFWAKGALGGEVVSFLVGGIGFGAPRTSTTPCADTVSDSLSKVKLTTTFVHYTFSLNAQTYAAGVIAGFGFVVAAADQPVRDGGAVTLYIDDIEWQP